MVTTKYIKLGWCNQYVAGRITLEELTRYVPELHENPTFLDSLTSRREARRLEREKHIEAGNRLPFAQRHPDIKAFAQLVKHAQEVTGMR